MKWPKKCHRCGHEYTEDQWEKLAYMGVQKSGVLKLPDLEMRQCINPGCSAAMTIPCPKDINIKKEPKA